MGTSSIAACCALIRKPIVPINASLEHFINSFVYQVNCIALFFLCRGPLCHSLSLTFTGCTDAQMRDTTITSSVTEIDPEPVVSAWRVTTGESH
ncbi:hypothetical protein EXN66_Car014860 [Channa argus]|uniref:Uncharacterized protein n=1 Tax=Channa argus TaxID=215402 RepID=A0A6G1QA19_CHAAH|nr:hypothetical protein EXN66_Car014860 [Channa argus]